MRSFGVFVMGMALVAGVSVGCGDDSASTQMSDDMYGELETPCDPFSEDFDADGYESGSCVLAKCDPDSEYYEQIHVDNRECPPEIVERFEERSSSTTSPETDDETTDSSSPDSTDAEDTEGDDEDDADKDEQSDSSTPDTTSKPSTRTVPKTTAAPSTTAAPTTTVSPPTTKKPSGATTTLPRRPGGTSTLP